MYGVALSVAACLRAGTDVDVAWAVTTEGLGSADPTEAVAFTPGGGRVGSLLGGALDDQLADVARTSSGGRLADLAVGELEAAAAGLASGGRARCLVVPAAELPSTLWDLLLARAPLALVTTLDGDRVVGTELETSHDLGAGPAVELLASGAGATRVLDDGTVVTVLVPVPTLVVVGAGPVAEAIARQGALVGWQVRAARDAAMATGLVAALAPLDTLVVVGHDLELTGATLVAALGGDVGYVGALGSRKVQQARVEWLAYRGVTDVSRVHGPAGLDIGARTPAEIAVSVIAEAIAVHASHGDGRPHATDEG